MADFRVTFSKDDVLVYISHLDLSHAFIRALNRAGVELKYSQGFNPHPKIVFALPLSIGMAGENELCDIGVADESVDAEMLARLLRETLPPHITVKSVEKRDGKLHDMSLAKYTVEISRCGIADGLTAFLSEEIYVMKKTKSGEKNVCISDGIRAFKVVEENGVTVITAVLSATEASYLNPELIMKAAREKGLLSDGDAYMITRKCIYFGTEAFSLD